MNNIEIYWKGETQPKGEFILYSEFGEERYIPNLISIDTDPIPYPPIPHEPMPTWWVDKVNSVKKRISKGEIQKEVIHRVITLPTHNIHPHQILKSLENHIGTHYAIHLPNNHVLFGITPEKPIQRRGDKVTIQILGGTDNNTNLLQQRDKVIEHTRIQEDLLNTIQNELHIKDITTTPLSLYHTGYTYHIQSHIHFHTTLPNETLIQHLHPNLAIRGNARDRGYFGGLIGWTDNTHLDLYLTIRCGIWNGHTFNFYVGCGITEYSDPHKEWEETHHKLKWLEI